MTKFSVAADFQGRPSWRLPPSEPQRVNQDAFLRRMERLNTRREDGRTGAVRSPPQHLDAKLLEEREALDAAWAYEVAAALVMKRLKTPEADAIAKAARIATAAVVSRIETATAMTLDGLKVKARARLWRRYGEPLEADRPNDQTSIEAQGSTSAPRDQ